MEAAIGFGLVIGPPLGSLMYGALGYQWTFYFSSILLTCSMINSQIFLPNKLNSTKSKNSVIQSLEKCLLSDENSILNNEKL